jgi:hypothetical protein
MADRKGTGLYTVYMDIAEEHEDFFNRWYNEEHIPELMSVPGILNAARYEAVKSGPKHLACYELESVAVVETDAFKNRPRTERSKQVGPRTRAFSNIYEMIYPTAISPEIAGSDMAPVLQIGRMDVGPENEVEWNQWYSGIYVPNYEKVPGCIRGRRWKAVRGEPQYAVVYELEDEKVSESAEWETQRDIDPSTARIRPMMTHADGSPGVWKKTFQL